MTDRDGSQRPKERLDEWRAFWSHLWLSFDLVGEHLSSPGHG